MRKLVDNKKKQIGAKKCYQYLTQFSLSTKRVFYLFSSYFLNCILTNQPISFTHSQHRPHLYICHATTCLQPFSFSNIKINILHKTKTLPDLQLTLFRPVSLRSRLLPHRRLELLLPQADCHKCIVCAWEEDRCFF